jgi:DNA polymerase III gamma/tau subunit
MDLIDLKKCFEVDLPNQILERVSRKDFDEALHEINDILNSNGELELLYREIILNNNFSILKNKTIDQIKQLKKIYFSESKLFGLKSYLYKKKKLKLLINFSNNFNFFFLYK